MPRTAGHFFGMYLSLILLSYSFQNDVRFFDNQVSYINKS